MDISASGATLNISKNVNFDKLSSPRSQVLVTKSDLFVSFHKNPEDCASQNNSNIFFLIGLFCIVLSHLRFNMVIPKRPKTDNAVTLPKLAVSPPRQLKRPYVQPRPPMSLPNLGGGNSGRHLYPVLRRFNSTSNNSCELRPKPLTASPYLTPLTRVTPTASLYDRLSRLNLTGVAIGGSGNVNARNSNTRNNNERRGSSRIQISNSTPAPTSRNYNPNLTSSLHQIEQNRYATSPRCVTALQDLPALDPRRLIHLQKSLQNAVMSKTSSSCSLSTTPTTGPFISFNKLSKTTISQPGSSTTISGGRGGFYAKTGLNSCITSKKSGLNKDQHISDTERVLSAYTILDPYHDQDMADASSGVSGDENNNTSVEIEYLIPPSSKSIERRIVSIPKAKKFPKSKQIRPSETRNPRIGQLSSVKYTLHKLEPTQNTLFPVEDPIKAHVSSEEFQTVKDLSSNIYQKLKKTDTALSFSSKHKSQRDDTLKTLKRAFAILQDELDQLNVNEQGVAAEGIDYKEFEKSQSLELNELRNSVQPYRTIVKELNLRPLDIRRRVPLLPIADFNELSKPPNARKSMPPKIGTSNFKGGPKPKLKNSKWPSPHPDDVSLFTTSSEEKQNIPISLSSSFRSAKNPAAAASNGRRSKQSVAKSEDRL